MPASNPLIAASEVPESAHRAYGRALYDSVEPGRQGYSYRVADFLSDPDVQAFMAAKLGDRVVRERVEAASFESMANDGALMINPGYSYAMRADDLISILCPPTDQGRDTNASD